MTLDERIRADLRSHIPEVDEAHAWAQVETAANAIRRRRSRNRVTLAVLAVIIGVIGVASVISTGGVDNGEVAESQLGVVSRLLDAANARDADAIGGMFTSDGELSPIPDWGLHPVHGGEVVDTWIQNLDAWGFDGELDECRPTDAGVTCEVRAVWLTLSMEAVERWTFTLRGDQIAMLRIQRVDLDPADKTQPLGLGDLDAWEEWLERVDPAKASRLLPDSASVRLIASFIRYDPGFAGEIGESIRQFLAAREVTESTVVLPNPDTTAIVRGKEISLTPDEHKVGNGWIILNSHRRTDGFYVLLGEVQGKGDLLFAPSSGHVLASIRTARSCGGWASMTPLLRWP